MLLEFCGGKQASYRVHPQHGGVVEKVSEVYAPDYFREMSGDVAKSPVASTPSSDTGAHTAASPARQLRRRAQATLERIFLPAGYPNSVTDDLLAFAMWDAAQVLATSVMSALSVRAVLLGVGVGESGANLTSSTLSWMMRDGTWLIGSIIFASVISQDLEYRAKSWRLVADITNDAATFLELCAPLLPGGQLTFRFVVVVASVIKALVGVCGGGTRASFTQHFALRGNAADVAAKAGTRGNVGSLIGLALGMAVAYIVPASSTALNLFVFALSTSFHLFANYCGVRAVQLRHLNAPRLEWCVEQFCVHQAQAVIAHKKDKTGVTGARTQASMQDITVHRANAQEPLFILPAPPVLAPGGSGLANGAYRFMRRYLRPLSLRLRLHCGASFHAVLAAQTTLSAAQKQDLIQQVEASLSTRGIALLCAAATESYHVILPEFYTVEGVPESWVRYKQQHEEGKQAALARQRRHHSGSAATAESSMNEEEGCRTAAEEADAEARAALERMRRERVVVPAHLLPVAYRELWAFFYAFMHQRAIDERRHAKEGAAAATVSAPLYVIEHLRADGRVATKEEEGGTQPMAEGATDATSVTMVDPATFEEMTSPTSTTSARAGAFPVQSAALSIARQDGLFAVFMDFVRSLRRAGWELDRLLLDNEGCTTVVHYL